MIFALNIMSAIYVTFIALHLLADRAGFATKSGAVVRSLTILSLTWLALFAVLTGGSSR